MTLICTTFSFHVRDKAQHAAALFFMAGAFGSVLAGGLLDPLHVLAGDDRIFVLPHLAEPQA